MPFLIDTGSPYCVIDESVIATWRLRMNNPVTIQTGLQQVVNRWHFDLSLRLHVHPSSDSWLHGSESVMSVPAGHFAPEGHKGIIGMSILCKGRLTFDGHTGVVTLDW
ncbi:hypothetical protein HLB44_35610 [Aquincola sp. S2]|uniref:Peptidase A2 domain-containing protein n=1 Tax=Pseudaquabacterium terrae TaxID=2732868 RepID=A0ABX2EUB0_9BURK|nr:hypothetical protein [Aquabacterium terrae]